VALREGGDTNRVDRPGQADLEQADAQGSRAGIVDTQILQRLAHVQIRLATGDDAQFPARGIEDHAVEPVDAGESLRRGRAQVDGARLLRQRKVVAA
jgi:hypothetical protein